MLQARLGWAQKSLKHNIVVQPKAPVALPAELNKRQSRKSQR